MKINNSDGWDSSWVVSNGYIFNERLGLKFTERDLLLYWVDRQRLRIYEKDRLRRKQFKFDFV